jgi:two-component system nitrogen regulation response regulator GlnG
LRAMSAEQHPQTEVNTGTRASPFAAVPRLTAISGPAQGRAFALASAMATVGRHPTNDLVLDDPRVSGVHLQLHRVEDRVRLRDVGSTNGTWLGRHRVTEIELCAGGEIILGGTVLRVDIDGAATFSPLSASTSFGRLVGQSTVMRELFATLERIAPKNIGILIQGETGTGKEEVARAIHERSTRASGPFVVIDATSLPDTLSESLLFGHEKGAFTGATERRQGFFESAHGGTILIDEIGELPAALQAKFLRVLERKEVTRLGGQTPIQVDVRVIAATHRDLRQEIEAGRFREDLYFRLAPVRIMLPPLRDRADDIPLLCQNLLVAVAGDRPTPLMIEADAIEHLAQQPWPGNVRELRNVLTRAAALASDELIKRSDVAGEGFGFRGMREERAALDLSGDFSTAKERAIERFESAYLGALMKRCGGNLSLASREADLARHHLREVLRKRGLYGISWPDPKGEGP